MRRRVLMIGLDAADPALIEQGIVEGWLPHLARLRGRGVFGRLASTADWLAGSPWPTFYTGTNPAEHGLYHWQQWRPEKMGLFRADPSWLPLAPFWRAWGAGDPRFVAFDVPMTYGPTPFNGIEVSGWASHDHLVPPASYPAAHMARITGEFGRAPMSNETYAPQPAAEVLALRDEYVATTHAVASAASAIAQRETWDAFLVVFGATHRAGHKLWSHRGTSDVVPESLHAAFPAALREVYVAADAAVGRVTEAVDADVTTMVFSLHGMGPNLSRAELVGDMLRMILVRPQGSIEETRRTTLLQRIRQSIPVGWRDMVKDRLPLQMRENLWRFWKRNQVNWSLTRAFAPDADLQGYVRVNQRGRERDGIIGAGEVDALLATIEEGLRSFVDADTSESIVKNTVRAAQHYPAGARRSGLPDLLVQWHDRPAAEHRALRSDPYGQIAWPCPASHPTGRSGNHRGEGFFIGVGPDFPVGPLRAKAHILDLAPTLHDLLGLPVPARMEGRSLVPAKMPSSDV